MSEGPQIATDDEQSADLAASVAESREDARLRKLFEDVRDLAVAAMQRAYACHTHTGSRHHMKQSYILQEAAGVIDTISKSKASGG